MAVFACAWCDAVLTAPVTQVALPGHAHQKWGNGVLLPALMHAGTYAVDPEPSGPPWRLWSEISADEAEARGVYAPVHALSYGAPGAIVVAPGDTRGTVLIPRRFDGYCCGLDGSSGPNLACAQCGRAVATRIDDCSLWQAVRLAPDAVHRIPVDAPTDQAVDWVTLVQEREGIPPVEPSGAWSPQWAAEVGEALAHLVAVSSGMPVAVLDGLVANVFGHVLEALLPSGPTAKTVALAGPGLPAPGPAADIALIPRHPRTGKPWQLSGTADTVPLAADVWIHLAFHNERLLVPSTGGLPDEFLRDAPPPMYPWSLFRPDSGVFLHTLARLPAVREPWLRRIYDRVNGSPYAHPF